MKDNKQKVAGFDLDGVIVDHTDIKLRLAKDRGYNILPKETHSNILKKILPQEILKEIQFDIYCNNDSQPLLVGAKNILQKIKDSKIPFYLISRRRNGDAREKAVQILKNRELWPEIFNENNVYFVETPEEKNKVAKKLGVTHYFDDEVDVLEAISFVKNRFLFDNFDNFPDTAFDRVSGWPAVDNILFS